MFINDKSHELINLYNVIAKQDSKFFNVVDEIMHNWSLLEVIVQTNSETFIDEYKKYYSKQV